MDYDQEVNIACTSCSKKVPISQATYGTGKSLICFSCYNLIARGAKPDRIVQSAEAPEKVKVDITLDEDKGFYRHKDLSLPEIKFLLSKGYKEYKQRSCFTNVKERYLLKVRYNESPQHFFMIIDIADYLKQFSDNVKIFETKKPDIVFELNGRKIAVEVETGSVLKNNKKQLLEKVAQLKKDYGKDWFFVLTNRNMKSQYEEFGKVIDKRFVKWNLDKILKNATMGNEEIRLENAEFEH